VSLFPYSPSGQADIGAETEREPSDPVDDLHARRRGPHVYLSRTLRLLRLWGPRAPYHRQQLQASRSRQVDRPPSKVSANLISDTLFLQQLSRRSRFAYFPISMAFRPRRVFINMITHILVGTDGNLSKRFSSKTETHITV